MTRLEVLPAPESVRLRAAALVAGALLATAAIAPPVEADAPSAPRAKVSREAAVGPPATVLRAESRVGFWAGEAVPGTDWKSPDTYWNRRATRLYTPELWSVLRRYRVPLYLNLRYRRDFGPIPSGKPHYNDALRLVRRANRHGVPIWGWVLIPYSSGYWAWEGAALEELKAVRALVRWTKIKRLRLKGAVLDIEPPLNLPFQSTAATMGAVGGFPALLGQTISPGIQCAAWRRYLRIVRWAKRHDVPLSASPSAAALDDIEDHRLALQDAAQFVLPPADWNELFFQAYRSVFAYYSGRDPGPGIVSSYLASARSGFGEAGQISLGSAGRGPYTRLRNLIHDVRLAATLGARKVPIYSLERTLRAYRGPASIVRLAKAGDRPFRGSRATEASAAARRARALRSAVGSWDSAAVSATRMSLDATGQRLHPNTWPNGCQAD
jgi:hypothetical protein